ncbi:hypothetical protein MPC4_180085 [Methylocella tundrae]|uniref:Uncharacterized protein n=1 Tax=Methylocella tundrae TaxID=227605 RepID=A0A8B6M5L8_METTU|nr:hypothetical protein MPC4_180085 [Methylocella tundrae]
MPIDETIPIPVTTTRLIRLLLLNSSLSISSRSRSFRENKTCSIDAAKPAPIERPFRRPDRLNIQPSRRGALSSHPSGFARHFNLRRAIVARLLT